VLGNGGGVYGISFDSGWTGWIALGGTAKAALAMSAFNPHPRKIIVILSRQHLWAYNSDGSLFLDTDVTTGRPELPTPAGDYHIFAKYSPYQFISPWPYGSPFWYPSAWVKYAMEFIGGGYFLHDAPWRRWYGPGSQFGAGTHGCINIPLSPMTQLWGWAQIGDEVVVQP